MPRTIVLRRTLACRCCGAAVPSRALRGAYRAARDSGLSLLALYAVLPCCRGCLGRVIGEESEGARLEIFPAKAREDDGDDWGF